MVICEILGVYLVDFKNNEGGEMSGKHYGLVLSRTFGEDGTLLVAPITSKKPGKKYKGGFTIECEKYQKNPTYKKAFIQIRKIREISRMRILSKKKYILNKEDTQKLETAFQTFFKYLISEEI